MLVESVPFQPHVAIHGTVNSLQLDVMRVLYRFGKMGKYL